MKRKKVCVLGSTGSVGTQALDVIRNGNFELCGISAHSSIDLLEEQIRAFRPRFCAVGDGEAARRLKIAVRDTETQILAGEKGILFLAAESGADIVLNSILGSAGILPTLAALEAETDVAMANKEPIVAAGELILRKAKEKGVKILPVDSEHSAIFQCLGGPFNQEKFISKIVLTASGGPFFGKKIDFLESVTPEMAVSHPVWRMGKKISVDSATLMNKGLELIEAVRFFGVDAENVEVTVHRQSIVHSMVTFLDGATLAQMGHPDMRHCVQFALTYPERTESLCRPLNFQEKLSLTFEPADEETFSLLPLARECVKKGGTATTVLNAANEAAVALFLDKKISFTDIFRLVEEEVERVPKQSVSAVEDILQLDRETKSKVFERFSH